MIENILDFNLTSNYFTLTCYIKMLDIFLGNINFILFFIWFPYQFGPDRFSRFHVHWIKGHKQTALSLYYLETGVNGIRKCLEKQKMVFKGTVNVF